MDLTFARIGGKSKRIRREGVWNDYVVSLIPFRVTSVTSFSELWRVLPYGLIYFSRGRQDVDGRLGWRPYSIYSWFEIKWILGSVINLFLRISDRVTRHYSLFFVIVFINIIYYLSKGFRKNLELTLLMVNLSKEEYTIVHMCKKEYFTLSVHSLYLSWNKRSLMKRSNFKDNLTVFIYNNLYHSFLSLFLSNVKTVGLKESFKTQVTQSSRKLLFKIHFSSIVNRK